MLATFKTDFYAAGPVLTVNRHGAGRVYYLAARPAKDAFHDALAAALVREASLTRSLDTDLPEGVTVQKRAGGGRTFLFLHNLKGIEQSVDLGRARLRNLADDRILSGRVSVPPYASWVLEPASLS